MEIVAGTARGLILTSPGENDEVRPTSVRARRAFFDSLGDLKGNVFADIFAGSGAMGLEAASRGAEKVFFFEQALPRANEGYKCMPCASIVHGLDCNTYELVEYFKDGAPDESVLGFQTAPWCYATWDNKEKFDKSLRFLKEAKEAFYG